MPDEASLFETKGKPWSARAQLSELAAVLSGSEDRRFNMFLHGTSLYAASIAVSEQPVPSRVLDFGCGNGRLLRFFDLRGYTTAGTEVTAEMLEAARRHGTRRDIVLHLTDGVHIPEVNNSFDMIWCCGVLRYSLFVEKPKYNEIAREMFRVLRPGGKMVNLEMYVDCPPDVFTTGFKGAGFQLESVGVVHRYGGGLERVLFNRLIPVSWLKRMGSACAALRLRLDSPYHVRGRMRDYLISYRKPYTDS